MAPVIRSEADMPHLLNDRGVMVQNDTHVYDLMQLAPIGPNGWVLLGDTARYVSVSSKRFHRVAYTTEGITVSVSGAVGETVTIVALQPCTDDARLVEDWTVI